MATSKAETDKTAAAEQTATPAVSLSVGATELAQAMVIAQEQLLGTRRKIPFGQEKITNPFNKSGQRERKLQKEFFQNGGVMWEHQLNDEEIRLLHLIKPGQYIDNLVTVTERKTPDGAKVHIMYANSSADQRMALGSRIGGVKPPMTGLQHMLEMIIAEYNQQQADLKAKRKAEIEEALS